MRPLSSTLVIIVLFVTNFSLKAQSPTYDQTVDYLISKTKDRVMYSGDLDSYNRTVGYHLTDIKIEKNGNIELTTDQKNERNDFKIVFNILDLVEKEGYPGGIRNQEFLLHFNGLNVSKGYGITYATEADAQRVARAFRHLKSLCVREADLFDKPLEDEQRELDEKARVAEEKRKEAARKTEKESQIKQTVKKINTILESQDLYFKSFYDEYDKSMKLKDYQRCFYRAESGKLHNLVTCKSVLECDQYFEINILSTRTITGYGSQREGEYCVYGLASKTQIFQVNGNFADSFISFTNFEAKNCNYNDAGVDIDNDYANNMGHNYSTNIRILRVNYNGKSKIIYCTKENEALIQEAILELFELSQN